jgi:hypothetical protein
MDDDEVVTYLAKTTPINTGKTPCPKVINHKYFTHSCRPSEESNTRRSLHLPNPHPRKKERAHLAVIYYNNYSL